MIKVLVVDDHALMRAGVSGVLNGAGGIQVVGECTDGDQVPRAAASVGPDVVVMDVVMPVMSGIDATRALKLSHPAVRVLILTGFLTEPTVLQAFEVGASGFLLKGDPDRLVSAVRTVAAGGSVWPDDLPFYSPGVVR